MKALLTAMALLLAVLSPIFPESADENDTQKVVTEINSIRKNAHLTVLAADESAFRSAQAHAEELAERLNLSHQGLDGFRVTDRYRAAGGTGLTAGENLGAGDSTDLVIRAWLDSPGHRENLLNPKWRKIGVGLETLDSGRIILVAVFTDSRWSGGDIRLSDGRLYLTGEFLLIPGHMPEAVYMKYDSRLFEPESVRRIGEELLILVFDLPIPGEWEAGRFAPVLLGCRERGMETESDLLLLSEP